MTFVAPLFLLVLALALPVIVAFLVRRRKQVLVVPSVLRWQRVAVAKHRSRRFRNLSRLLALLACVAAVIALGMAAARPRLLGDGALTVIVIDVSPSMGTPDEGPLADALDRVRELASAMGPRDRVAIFAAGEAPRRVLAPTDDPSRVRAVLAEIAPESRAELASTLALARSLADDERNARVVLLHDGGAHVEGADVLEERFGDVERPNVGLTLFAARPARDAANDDEREVLVAVAAAGEEPRRVRVRLFAREVELGARELVVPPGEEADARFRLRLPVRELSAEVEPLDARGDALSTDDRATLRLAAASAPPVRWMAPIVSAPAQNGTTPPTPTGATPTGATPTGATPTPADSTAADSDPHATRRRFAEHALRSAGATDLAALEGELPADAVVVSLGAPSRRVDAPLLILGGVAPEGSDAATTPVVPAHAYGYGHRYGAPTAALAPRAYWPEGVRSLGALEGEATTLHRVDDTHPLTRGVDLDGLTILRAVAIDPGDGVPLVELDGTRDENGARRGGVVVAAGGEGSGRWVYLGLDPDGSDVVLRVAYPLLVASSLAWLSGSARTEVATTPTRAEVALERAPETNAHFDGLGLPLPPLPWLLAALATLLLAAEGLAYARRLVS
jgi:hypothetical protein